MFKPFKSSRNKTTIHEMSNLSDRVDSMKVVRSQWLGVSRGTLGFALCALLLLFSVLAEAQQSKKIPRVGDLSFRHGPLATREGIFLVSLRKLRYVEGPSVTVEYRYAEDRLDRLPGLVGELV